MIDTREEALERVFFIHYPVQFKNTDKAPVQALIDSGSEVNAVHPSFIKQLDLPIRPTNVGAQKIDGTMLDTHGMVIEAFSVVDMANRVRFFEETFLVANVSLEVVLEMSFLILSGADVDFLGQELRWRTYTIEEALPTTRRVELVGKKEFAAVALDPEHETYVVHVVSLNVYPSRKPQISGLIAEEAPVASLNVHPFRRSQISGLIAKEALTKVFAKYSDFADIFSPDLASELLEYIGINDHAIELVKGQQPLYGPIYSLGPVELETLKAYIETNLANGFIRPSKLPAGAPILFDQKSDSSFRLCVDYWGLNNLTIKNRYPLPLIEELLDRLGRAKRFTQLELTSAYHRMRIRKGDEWKTAFRTRYGHFEYQVMPFGLTNAPASFQGYINKILAEKLDIFVIVYLDDILIYTDDDGDGHVSAVRWVLEQLRKFSLFANLKKCRFHQEEVRFLGYVVSSKGIRIEDERIEAVKQWPEPQSIRDIQVFLGFANFYRRFIQGFSRIAAPLTLMLKTSGSTESKTRPGEGGVGVGGSRAGRGGSKLDGGRKIDDNGVDGDEVDDDVGTTVQKSSKSKEAESGFLTSGAKKAFTKLRQAFIKAPILHHFDLEYHIRVESDASGYVIDGIFSKLTLNNLRRWHPVAFFLRKMIAAETRYETHDGELLTIVEAFKTWRHYLKGS